MIQNHPVLAAFRWLVVLAVVLVTVLGGNALRAQSYTVYKDLYDFKPYAGPSRISFDGAGNMYGTLSYGGAYGGGEVWEITTAGAYMDLHDFGGTVTNANGTVGLDGADPIGGVEFDGAGNMYGTTYQGGPNGEPHGDGMVWEIAASGAYTDVHDFGGTVINANGKSGPDGYAPAAGAALDPQGNVYGTTFSGGPLRGGVIWEVTSTGAYVDDHDFGGATINANGTSGPDGAYPTAAVEFDTTSDMYGTARFGGALDDGMAWEITSSHKYIDLHDFGGTVTNADGGSGPDGLYPEAALAFDSAGNVHGTCLEGGPDPDGAGDYGGVEWELTTGGSYKDLHDFGGITVNANGADGPDGSGLPAGPMFDGAGNTYGTTEFGGGLSYGMVWELTASGKYKDLHDFGEIVVNADGTSGPDGASPLVGASFDSASNIYGTTNAGGANGGGMIWELLYSEPTTVALTSSPNPSSCGQSVTFTATIGPAVPDGETVTFYDGATSIGTGLTSGSAATLADASFSVGTHSITAQYPGDANNLPSTSSTVSQVVNQVPTSTTVVSTLNPSIWGQSVTFTATVGPSVPDGETVTFYDGGTSIGTGVTAGSTATFATSTLAVGAHSITAQYEGDTTNSPSTSSAVSQVVDQISTSTAVTSSLNPSKLGQSVTFTATVTPAVSDGETVSFYDNTTSIGSGITTGSSASFATSSLSAGTQSITATYAGDMDNATSTSSILSQVVTVSTRVMSLKLSPTKVIGGQSSTGTVTLNATAPSGGFKVHVKSLQPSIATVSSATVIVPAGATTTTFTVNTATAAAKTAATISASANAVTKKAVLTILPSGPQLQSLGITPATVVGGSSAIGTVTLTQTVTTPITVTLSSNNPAAQVPASVTIASGSYATFTVATTAVSAQILATVTATYAGSTKKAKVTIKT